MNKIEKVEKCRAITNDNGTEQAEDKTNRCKSENEGDNL